MPDITPIIGLEIHVELTTKSKMFCDCEADHFGKAPNSQTCPVCLGLPGALPVPNQLAIEDTILIGLALNCSINQNSNFDRKQYFYPDLPKGYQISQYQHPFCSKGFILLDSGKKIRIERIHLEEDTGKLTHRVIPSESRLYSGEVEGLHSKKVSLVDFNRSGVPLVEIVSYPDMNSADEAKEYLKKIHQIIRTLGVSTADMEKGQMRLEPTVNVRIVDGSDEHFTPLVEIKNINSFNFASQAINYEINRLTEQFLADGQEKSPSNKQTRGFDNQKKVTFSQRQKEEAKDYRYFPEPDIPPFVIETPLIEKIKARLPKLPEATIQSLISLGIEPKYAKILHSDKFVTATLFDFAENQPGVDIGKLASLIANKKILIKEDILTQYQTITRQRLDDKAELKKIIDIIITENPKAVSDYQNGKTNILGFLVGQVMKHSQGKADPQTVSRLLLEKLSLDQ
jgi:aspartyl-tRNA(Asn)/glutamyl-tRNA(Gln) amidotransferase subunit B